MSFLIRTFILIALASLSLTSPKSAAAFDLGPLSEIITPRSDGTWSITDNNGVAIFENQNAPYAITYYYLNPRPGEEGKREISVDIGMLNFEPDSRAGLLYGFEDNPRSYFMFTVGGDRSVNLQFFEQGNMEERMKLGISSLQADKTTLTIRERGNEIALIVNGEEKSVIGNDRIGRGAVGIVAAHVGRYSFQNFSVTAQGAALETGPTRNAPDQDAPVIVKRAQIMDHNAPFGPTPAGFTLIPEDWRIDSHIQWFPPNACKRGPQLTWSAVSPDERYSVSFFQGLTWAVTKIGSSPYGCIREDIRDSEQALRAFAAQLPGTQVLEIARPPELDMLKAAFSASAAQMPPNAETYLDGALARLKVVEPGKTSEVAVIMLTNHLAFSGLDVFGNPAQNRSGSAIFTVLFAAPEGRLDAGHPAFSMVMQNYEANPQWMQGANAWWQQALGTIPRPTPATGGGASGGGKSVGDILHEGYMNRSGLRDAGQRRAVDAIWDVNSYQTSTGRQTFSTQYNQVWQLNDGRYALTNDNFFNPDRMLGISGTQLQQLR